MTVYDDNGNLIKTVTGTGSTIEYSYDETFVHRLVSSTNGLTTNSFTYDSFGNVLSSILSASGTSLQIRSSSVYANSGNQLGSATDSNGITASYSYSAAANKMLGLPSAVTDANGTTTSITYDNFGRTRRTAVANLGNVQYYYSQGNLTRLVRYSGNLSQYYQFAYDSFGNMIDVLVGGVSLVTYEYNAGNGPLLTQRYANGDTVTFTYDYLGRIKTETFDDGRVVTYTYNGEGQLCSVTETGGDSPAAYYYIYDSNGRLVSSEKRSSAGKSLMRVNLSYNDAGQLVGQVWNIGGTEYIEGYTYNAADGTLNTMTTATGQTLQMNYDALRRLSSVSSSRYTKSYTYRNLSNTQTTTQVTNLTYTGLPVGLNYSYTYNNLGNIATCTMPDGEVITYTYDALGQLLSAVGDTTYTYTYDKFGNILTANGHTYTYDTTWRDLLVAYDNVSFTFDASANPLRYYNGTQWTFTWENGRSLATARTTGKTISYAYDSDGLRTSKTVNGVVHNYYYASGKLLRETYGSNVLDFSYDANGNPYALKYNGVIYYYITNLQGDVMYLVNSAGTTVATYEYDPYGNIVSATGTMAEINPLRYRGYYYDIDTGFYYLQSRYYDPTIGRFINADSLVSTGQGILGNNMFAYCLNNPVSRIDSSGHFWDTIFDVASLVFSVVDVIQNPDDVGAWVGLVLDVVDVVVPIVSGLGEAADAANAARKITNTATDAKKQQKPYMVIRWIIQELIMDTFFLIRPQVKL